MEWTMTKLLGDKPFQAPTNADLGDLAYQDGANAVIGPIAVSGDSVDVNGAVTSNGLTVGGVNYPSTGPLSNRNLVINGDMRIAQRGTSVTGVTTLGYYTCDRFLHAISGLGTHTITQAADGPSGFANSLKVEVTTANASPAGNAFLTIEYGMEGQDLQALKKGTADALPVTLSFWVKSNVTGTYILEIDDADNARKINKAYTVNQSSVWEYKTITFEGDTSGVLDDDNFRSMRLIWWLDAGSDFRSGTLQTSWGAGVTGNRVVGNVAFANTVGNTFQITGVQLEAGTVATPFEHRSFGQELALCQRYCYVHDGTTSGISFQHMTICATPTTSQARACFEMPVQMRTTPTLTLSTAGNFALDTTGGPAVCTSTAVDRLSRDAASVIFNSSVSFTANGAVRLMRNNLSTPAKVELSAEL
jgi:hypothetical protein